MPLLDNKDRLGSLLLLLFALVYLHYARLLPIDPTTTDAAFASRTLPIGLAVTTIVLALLQLALSTRTTDASRLSSSLAGFNWRPAILLTIAMAVFSVFFSVLGFIISSVAFLIAGFAILGERRPLVSIATALGIVLPLWLLLTQVFGLYLDNGALFRALLPGAK